MIWNLQILTKVVIFSLLLEEIRERIDDVVYEDGFLKFYKNNTLFKTFDLTTRSIVEEIATETSEVEIKKSFRLLKDNIRRYGL